MFEQYTKRGHDKYIIMTSICTIYVMVSFIAITILINMVEIRKMKVYHLFLEIPNDYINTLHSRVESFLSRSQITLNEKSEELSMVSIDDQALGSEINITSLCNKLLTYRC